MAPLGNTGFWGKKKKRKKKKKKFHGLPNLQYRCEKLPTCFLTIGPNKGGLQFGYW